MSGRNSSISYCFENQFWSPWCKWKKLCKRNFLIRRLDVRQMIPSPFWIIPFPVLKNNFELLGANETPFIKEVFFYQRPGSGSYNFNSCFENKFWTPRLKWDIFCKRSFSIRGLEVRKIISFSVWIIPFPVLKINFQLHGINKKHL